MRYDTQRRLLGSTVAIISAPAEPVVRSDLLADVRPFRFSMHFFLPSRQVYSGRLSCASLVWVGLSSLLALVWLACRRWRIEGLLYVI